MKKQRVPNGKSPCAICYVADEGFLFPAVASALSLRRFVTPQQADIVLFYIGVPLHDYEATSALLDSMGIKLLGLNDTILRSIECKEWVGGHVSPAALGRFAVGEYMAEHYGRMLYVDGDTIFDRDPSALIDFDPGADRISAVDDIRSFARHDAGRFGQETRDYFKAIGVGSQQGYFNSGVFVVRTESWRKMAADALGYFSANVAKCKLHDQSAMNAVLGRWRVPLSLSWNFQTPFKSLLMERAVNPVIRHFTGSNKPWVGPLDPFRDHLQWYEYVERTVAPLIARPTWSEERIAAQNKETRFFFYKMHVMFAPRVLMKRRAILRYERDTLATVSAPE